MRLFTTTTLLLRQSSSSPNFCFLYYAVDPTSWKLFSSGAWFYSSRPTLQGPAFTSIILSRNHSMDLFSIRTLSLRHYPAGSNNIVLFLFLCCARRKEKKEKKKKLVPLVCLLLLKLRVRRRIMHNCICCIDKCIAFRTQFRSS